jgi:hypothetical protein
MNANEPSDTPVVTLLNGIRKEAGRQLAAGPVIGNALTADTFSGAGIVTAIAVLHVFFLVRALLFAGCTHRSGSHPF